MIIISPAKTLDWTSPIPKNLTDSFTRFDTNSQKLIETLQQYSTSEIVTLMNISENLAQKNYQRYQNWQTLTTRPAIYSFKGGVYAGFDIDSTSTKIMTRIQREIAYYLWFIWINSSIRPD